MATQLVIELLGRGARKIYLLSRYPERISCRYASTKDVRCLSYSEFFKGTVTEEIGVCVHTAFARSETPLELDESVALTRKLGEYVHSHCRVKFIYLSSQSVYGNNYVMNADEKVSPNPENNYARAKYLSEKVLHEIYANEPDRLYVLRLASICERPRFIQAFVNNCISGLPICVTNPERYVSFIDIRDVAAYICDVIDTNMAGGVYNLAGNEGMSILDMALLVKKIGISNYNLSPVEINVTNIGKISSACMSSKKLNEAVGFRTSYTLESMINSLFQLNLFPGKGKYPEAFNFIYNL